MESKDIRHIAVRCLCAAVMSVVLATGGGCGGCGEGSTKEELNDGEEPPPSEARVLRGGVVPSSHAHRGERYRLVGGVVAPATPAPVSPSSERWRLEHIEVPASPGP